MIETFIKLLLMLLAGNGAPVLAARLLQSHFATAVDLGCQLPDGKPLLGSSKTWRGLMAALFASCILSLLFGYGLWFGLFLGGLAMAGDLFSSFIKRRMGLQPSARCLGLDQLPESVFPSIYAVTALNLGWLWVVFLPLAFMLTELLISKPLFMLKLRKRPH